MTKRMLILTMFSFLMVFMIGCNNNSDTHNSIQYEEKKMISYKDEEIMNNDDIRDDVISITIDKGLSNPHMHCSKELIEKMISSINYETYSDESYYYFNYSSSLYDSSIQDYRYIFYVYIKEPCKENLIRSIHLLEKVEGIYCVNVVGTIRANVLPSDPLYFQSGSYNGQYGINNVDALDAWDFTTGSSDIRVGVLDSTISQHDDLIDNMIIEEIQNNIEYNKLLGGNFIGASYYLNPLAMPDVEIGHGTHVAGIIGASSNEIGVVGVNWNITIVPLRVMDDDRIVSTSACELAIDFATSLWNTPYRIHILNLSFGSTTSIDNLLDNISNFPGIVVCSTGNEGSNNDIIYNYPSFYGSSLYSNPLDNIISVGRVDINDQRPTLSNYGENTVDIFAPGEDIISTYPNELCSEGDSNLINPNCHFANGYHFNSGSSMSAPFVTGAIALLMSIIPTLSNQSYIDAIINGADLIEINVPNTNGSGSITQQVRRLNVYKSVAYILKNHVATNVQFPNNDTVIKTYGVLSPTDFFVDNNQFLKLSVNRDGIYSFSSTCSGPIDVSLYDKNMDECNISLSYSNNHCNATFSSYLYTSNGPYYLRVSFDSSNNLTLSTQITPPHMHIYSYTWIDTTKHNVLCSCGINYSDFHIVEEGAFNNGLLARCLLCGGIARFGGIIHRNSDNSIYERLTDNGSFRLPNGVIVLVEKDIMALYRGELVIDGKLIVLNNSFYDYIRDYKDGHNSIYK